MSLQGLSIPRRKKIKVPDALFRAELKNILYWLVLPIVVSGALLIAVIDTVFWLGCCLSFASPMLLSALYEAYLDYKVIGDLREPFALVATLAPRDKAAVLFAILIGNLDLEIATTHTHQDHTGPTSEDDHFTDNSSEGNSMALGKFLDTLICHGHLL